MRMEMISSIQIVGLGSIPLNKSLYETTMKPPYE